MNMFKRTLLTCYNNNNIGLVTSFKINSVRLFCDKKESPLKGLLEGAATFDDVKVKPVHPEQNWSTLPYPQGASTRLQSSHMFRPNVDPKNTSIILFPGQGTQFVGMAKDLIKFPMAKDLFELANYILKYDLLKLCLNGPKEELDKTKYAQPAIVVSSLAALERLKEERPNAIENCVATAGFSLGEITALIFAGALPFEKALRLVQIRGEAMQMASETCDGGMATVYYGPDSKLGEACIKAKQWALDKGDAYPECMIASYMFPHCKVIAGSKEALNYVEKNLKEFKLRRMQRLNVSGAFHSSHMLPALHHFKGALKKMDISDPVISVHSTVDGKRYKDALHIKRQLPKQMMVAVKWEQLMHVLYERPKDEDFPRTFECGPGSTLKTLLKQVNAKAWDSCITVEA